MAADNKSQNNNFLQNYYFQNLKYNTLHVHVLLHVVISYPYQSGVGVVVSGSVSLSCLTNATVSSPELYDTKEGVVRPLNHAHPLTHLTSRSSLFPSRWDSAEALCLNCMNSIVCDI